MYAAVLWCLLSSNQLQHFNQSCAGAQRSPIHCYKSNQTIEGREKNSEGEDWPPAEQADWGEPAPREAQRKRQAGSLRKGSSNKSLRGDSESAGSGGEGAQTEHPTVEEHMMLCKWTQRGADSQRAELEEDSAGGRGREGPVTKGWEGRRDDRKGQARLMRLKVLYKKNNWLSLSFQGSAFKTMAQAVVNKGLEIKKETEWKWMNEWMKITTLIIT